MTPATATRPRVLWVTEEPPDRTLGGGNIRLAHLVAALASATELHLVAIGRVGDAVVRERVASLTEVPKPALLFPANRWARRLFLLAHLVLSRQPAYAYPVLRARRALARALPPAASDVDVVVVEHEALAPILPKLPRARTVVDLQHVFSLMAGQELAKVEGARRRLLWRAEVRKAQRLERWLLRAYDRVLACSEEDAAYLAGLTGGTTAPVVVPNGVDVAAFRATPVPDTPTVLFPGTLSFPPNRDGALWFCAEVWPAVKAAVPEARLAIVGRQPPSEVTALAELEGVEVHGDVPSLAPWFEAARSVVVPLRVGTGTRLKALEAMASARPVVGTTIGLEGLGLTDGVDARIADDPAAMAAAVVEVLTDGTTARRLATNARTRAETYFDWQRIGAHLVAEVEALVRLPLAPGR